MNIQNNLLKDTIKKVAICAAKKHSQKGAHTSDIVENCRK